MNIFDINLFSNGVFNKEQLINKIIDYFSSDTSIYNIHCMEHFPLIWISGIISIKKIIEFYLLTNGIPIGIDELKILTIWELIQLFLNIEQNLDKLTNEYLKEESKTSLNLKSGHLLNIDLYIKNLITAYIKNEGVKLVKKNNKIMLDFSQNLIFVKNKNTSIKVFTNDYLLIKDKKDISSLERKNGLLSALKNNLDNYFKNINIDINNQYISLNHAKLKANWQTLCSHKSGKTNKPNIETIKEEFNNLTLPEKHKHLDNLFDAIVYLQYINYF